MLPGMMEGKFILFSKEQEKKRERLLKEMIKVVSKINVTE